MRIAYKNRRNYKYVLAQSCEIELPMQLEQDICTHFICLTQSGSLQLAQHYAWDGASGPMPDFASIMRASLVHDALYQLMREGALPRSYRKQADQILRTLCIADGMNIALANWVYYCVRVFGERFVQSDLKWLSPKNTSTGISTQPNTENRAS